MNNDGVNIEMQNLKEVEEMFNKIGLTVKQQAAIWYKLNSKAGRHVVNALKQNAPSGDNDKKPQNKIENNVIMAKSKDNPTGVWIGFKKRAWYVKLIELGVNTVRIVKGKRKGKYKGASRGTLDAQPFIQRSHEQATSAVIKELNEDYLKNINNILIKETKRVNNKIKKGK